MSLPDQTTGCQAAGGSPRRSNPSATNTAAPSASAAFPTVLCSFGFMLSLAPSLRFDTGLTTAHLLSATAMILRRWQNTHPPEGNRLKTRAQSLTRGLCGQNLLTCPQQGNY